MSIIVKGMEMPKNCGECSFLQESVWRGKMFPCVCVAGGFVVKPSETDLKDGLCPLVELPEKHGRLIDAEALIDMLEQAIAIMETMLKQLDLEADDGCLMELKAYRDIRDGIKEIDAVIEAEGEE